MARSARGSPVYGCHERTVIDAIEVGAAALGPRIQKFSERT